MAGIPPQLSVVAPSEDSADDLLSVEEEEEEEIPPEILEKQQRIGLVSSLFQV